MKAKINLALCAMLALSLLFSSSCTRSGVEHPGPIGPSTLAIILDVIASPNVIVAGPTRGKTTITASLKKFDGVPLANETVHFDLRNALGNKVYLGLIDSGYTTQSKVTDSNGIVSITYEGPLDSELDVTTGDNFFVYLHTYVGWEGKEFVQEIVPLHIIGDVYGTDLELDFQIQAYPNVLWCTSKRPKSEIRGIFMLNGLPVVGKRVYFKILSGEGKFEDGFLRTWAKTNSQGIAKVNYLGPLNTEIDFDTFVEIQGQPQTDWLQPPDDPDDPGMFYIHKEMLIRLIKGHD